MSRPSQLSRVIGGGALTFLLASACGGRSFGRTDGNEAGSSQGGSVSVAGKTSAGAPTSGGKVGIAGAGGSGALGGTGAGSAGAGVGGEATGGYTGEGCIAPPVGGECDAYFPAWYHDSNTGICRPFVYGGCGGNANRYGSLAECQKACGGGYPNYDECAAPSDCVIASNGCCGVCDVPDLTTHDVIAYNPKYQRQLLCNFVRGAGPDRDVPACEPCPVVGAGVLKYLVPECVRGQCGVADLRESRFTACESDADCVVRSGTACCPECNTSQQVALRKDAEIEKLVCNGTSLCSACAPSLSRAVCSAGRCAIQDPSL